MGRDVDVTLTYIAYLKMETVIAVASVDRIRVQKWREYGSGTVELGFKFTNCIFFTD